MRVVLVEVEYDQNTLFENSQITNISKSQPDIKKYRQKQMPRVGKIVFTREEFTNCLTNTT